MVLYKLGVGHRTFIEERDDPFIVTYSSGILYIYIYLLYIDLISRYTQDLLWPIPNRFEPRVLVCGSLNVDMS